MSWRSIVLITPPRSWAARILILLAAVALLGAIPTIGSRLLRGWIAGTVGDIAIPKYLGIIKKLGPIPLARSLRLAGGTNTTDTTGVNGLLALYAWNPADFHLELRRTTGETRARDYLPDSTPLGLPPHLWGADLIPLVRRGLTPPQRRFLEEVARRPEVSALERFAQMNGPDLRSAKYAFPGPASPSPFPPFLPIPRLRRVDDAFAGLFARAAIEASAGKLGAADTTLRRAVGAGLTLVEQGELSEVLTGVVLVRRSLAALAALDELSGDSLSAQRIRIALLDSTSVSLPPAVTRKELTADALETELPGLLAIEEIPPAIRWAYVTPVALQRRFRICVGLDDPGVALGAWYEAARRHLVRTAADSAYLDWITHPPTTVECPAPERDSTTTGS